MHNILKRRKPIKDLLCLELLWLQLEELGLEMAIRSLEYLLQHGKQNIGKAVPLGFGLLCISNRKVVIWYLHVK